MDTSSNQSTASRRASSKRARRARAALIAFLGAVSFLFVAPGSASASASASCISGTTLTSGHFITSPAVEGTYYYKLTMQTDGNLVEYGLKDDGHWHALWDTQTNGNSGASASIQGSDGNLVVYSSSHHPLWAAWGYYPYQPAPTSPHARLCLQTDGNLVIYAANSSTAVWANGANLKASFGATRATRNTNYPVGQCTYWADGRFNAWTGKWIAWTGNANQWPANARALGWTVGGVPKAGSIVEYEPWHYGAGSVGHVAWVLDYYPNLGKVLVSEMNFNGDGGGLNRVDYRLVSAIDSANIHYIYVNPAP